MKKYLSSLSPFSFLPFFSLLFVQCSSLRFYIFVYHHHHSSIIIWMINYKIYLNYKIYNLLSFFFFNFYPLPFKYSPSSSFSSYSLLLPLLFFIIPTLFLIHCLIFAFVFLSCWKLIWWYICQHFMFIL